MMTEGDQAVSTSRRRFMLRVATAAVLGPALLSSAAIMVRADDDDGSQPSRPTPVSEPSVPSDPDDVSVASTPSDPDDDISAPDAPSEPDDRRGRGGTRGPGVTPTSTANPGTPTPTPTPGSSTPTPTPGVQLRTGDLVMSNTPRATSIYLVVAAQKRHVPNVMTLALIIGRLGSTLRAIDANALNAIPTGAPFPAGPGAAFNTAIAALLPSRTPSPTPTPTSPTPTSPTPTSPAPTSPAPTSPAPTPTSPAPTPTTPAPTPTTPVPTPTTPVPTPTTPVPTPSPTPSQTP